LDYQTLRQKIIDIIADIAVDEDLSNIDDAVRLRDQLDLDSMDFLDIVMELKKRYKIEVPQEDYPKLATMQSCIEYLGPKFGLSGLAAGIRLAMFDQKVCILERHKVPGGLNSYYERLDRKLDVGLHAMTNFALKGERGRPLTKLLKQLTGIVAAAFFTNCFSEASAVFFQ